MRKLILLLFAVVGCYGATPTISGIEAIYRDDNCVAIKWTTNQLGTSAGSRLDYGTTSAEAGSGTYRTRSIGNNSASSTHRNANTCNMRGKVYFRPVSWDTGHVNESAPVLCTNAGGAVITNPAYATQADSTLQFRCDTVGEYPWIDFGAALSYNPDPARPIHALDLDDEPSCDSSAAFTAANFQSVLDDAGDDFNANPNTNYCITSPATANFVIRPQDNTSRLDGWTFPNTDEGQNNWLTIKAGTPAKMRPPWGVQLSPEFLPWVPRFQWNEDDFWAISGNSTTKPLFQPYSGCSTAPCVEGIAFNGVAIVNPDRADLVVNRLVPTSYTGGTITVSGGVSSLRLSNIVNNAGSVLWIRMPGVFGLDGPCDVSAQNATTFTCSGKTGTGGYTGGGEIVQAQSIEVTSCTNETCTLAEDFPFFENGLGTVTSITSGNVINVSQTTASLQLAANDTIEIKGSSADGFYAIASGGIGANSITLSTNPGLANCTSGCTVAEARVVNILGNSDSTYNKNWYVDYTAGSDTVTLQRANLGSITGSGTGGFMVAKTTNLDVPIKNVSMKRTIFRGILKVDKPFALHFFGYLNDQQAIVDSWVEAEEFSQIDLLTTRCKGTSFPAPQGYYSGGPAVDFQGYRTTSLSSGYAIFKDVSTSPLEDVTIAGWTGYRGNEHISSSTLVNSGYFCHGYQNIFEFKNIERANIAAHFRGGSANRSQNSPMLGVYNFSSPSATTAGRVLDINLHDSIFYDGGAGPEFSSAASSEGDELQFPTNNLKLSNNLLRSDYMKYQALPSSWCGFASKCTNGGWGGFNVPGAKGIVTIDKMMAIPKNNPNTGVLTDGLYAPSQNLRMSNVFVALTQGQNVAGGGFHSIATLAYTRPTPPGTNGAAFLDHWEDMAGNGPTVSNLVLSGGTHFSLSGDTDSRWLSSTDSITIRADEVTAPNGGQGINGITGLLGVSTVLGAVGNPSESADARLDLALMDRSFRPTPGGAADGTLDVDSLYAANFIIPDALVQPVDSDTVRLTFTAPSISQNCWYQYTTVANGYGASADPDLVSEWILVPEDGVARSVDIDLTTAVSYDLRLSCGRSPIHRKFTTGAGSIASSAVTYYVDDTGGDDMNDCSEGAKCATIDHAASLTSPGDTVLVSDGTYDAVTIDVSGAKGLPIHIQAVNRHGAVIDGNGATQAVLVNDGKSWIDINGFEIVDALSGIVIGSGDGDNHHIRVRRNYIHDIGITQCSTSSGSFAGIKSKIDSSFILIEQNHFDNIGRRRPGESGCSPGNNNYMNHDHAIYIFGRNHVVRNNKSTNIDNGWSFQAPRGLYDTDVLFNTWYQTNPDRDGCIAIDNEANATETHGYNLRFVGDICIGTNGYISIAGDPLPCGDHTNTKVKYNLFSGATAVLDEFSASAASCADYLQHHNQPSTTATYVSAPTDLNLQAGSAGENDGPIGYVTDDYDGNARSTTAPDLGAFEQ